MKPILVLTTCPSRELADKIAGSLVEDRLAACVQISQPITSIYRWENKIHSDQEFQVFIKTQEAKFDVVCQKIRQLHSYEIPEIISIPIVNGLEAYLTWVGLETK